MKRYLRANTEYPENFDSIKADERMVVAESTTSPDLLVIYAYDPDLRVRECAAYNPHMPVDVLRELATDPSWSIRRAVVSNTSTPEDVLEGLAKDSCASIREAVAFNPNTPMSLIYDLAKDKDEDVRNWASMAINARLCGRL